MNRRSIRKFTNKEPTDAVVETLVRAGQQAPFAYQMGSLLLSRKLEKNPFHAPLFFIICVDSHRHETVMKKREWKIVQNDLSILLFGIQDAAYMAENIVIAAESLEMGSCYLGAIPYNAEHIIEEYNLPKRIFPLVGLTVGYPAEDPTTRPRYPIDVTLGENEYPQLSDKKIETAMQKMDKGYLDQDYYRHYRAMIPLQGDKEETFTYDNYSWTEHISRKTGQWQKSPHDLLEQFAKCGFYIPGYDRKK